MLQVSATVEISKFRRGVVVGFRRVREGSKRCCTKLCVHPGHSVAGSIFCFPLVDFKMIFSRANASYFGRSFLETEILTLKCTLQVAPLSRMPHPPLNPTYCTCFFQRRPLSLSLSLALSVPPVHQCPSRAMPGSACPSSCCTTQKGAL